MLELPNDFHPTDMHWFPRGHHGGGSVKTQSKRGGSTSQGNELRRYSNKKEAKWHCNLDKLFF